MHSSNIFIYKSSLGKMTFTVHTQVHFLPCCKNSVMISFTTPRMSSSMPTEQQLNKTISMTCLCHLLETEDGALDVVQIGRGQCLTEQSDGLSHVQQLGLEHQRLQWASLHITHNKHWPSRPVSNLVGFLCLVNHCGHTRVTTKTNTPVFTQIQIRVHFFFPFFNCSVCFLEKFEYFHFFSVSFCSQWKLKNPLTTLLPEKWWTLVLCNENTSFTLNCPRNHCWDYTKHNTETDTMAARSHETYTNGTENPELDIFRTGKQTNHNIYDLYDFPYFCLLKMYAYRKNMPKPYE